jgi:antitoxin ParD1/3/4
METTSLNISLSEALKEFVETKVSSGSYTSASEYVRELIRAARKKEAEEELISLLEAGLNSGPPTEATPEFWANLKRDLEARLAKKSAA